jgi:hypothetical protein
VVQIKAIEKDDLIPLCGLVEWSDADRAMCLSIQQQQEVPCVLTATHNNHFT